MGVEQQNVPNFRFGRNMQVRDAEVMGKIAGSKPGKVVLVAGENGVYAYRIKANAKGGFPLRARLSMNSSTISSSTPIWLTCFRVLRNLRTTSINSRRATDRRCLRIEENIAKGRRRFRG